MCLWARNKEVQKFDAEACENDVLDDVAIRLDGLRRLINTKDDGPATKIIGRMWRVLNDTAAIVRPLTEEERQRAIQQLSQFRRSSQPTQHGLRRAPNPRCPYRSTALSRYFWLIEMWARQSAKRSTAS